MEDAANLLDGLDVDIPVAGPNPQSGDGFGQAAAEFFGPYQLIQQVGQGGVARVLRARHIHPRYADTTFAIKILHEELSRDPNVVTLFRHEAYVLSVLKHPNIVQTFEAGSQDDKLFIAMEYIDGRDLDNMLVRCLKARIPLPQHVAMHIVSEALKGLAFAHELCDGDGHRLNLVHRDVNPANVFLSYDGRVKLGDFGVAAIIAKGLGEQKREVAGKVGYFAPEQLEGEDVDQRADLFAMGVMLFEILTGNRLFAADNADKMIRLNRRAKIPKPSSLNPALSPELEAVILQALERKPGDRFASAREMLQALAPFTPARVGMPLAVAALMRKVFSSEHIQELQLREGLAGGSMARGSGQLVLVHTNDERALAAFNELFLSRGYRPEMCPTVETLTTKLASPNPPAALLVDVCHKGFSAGAFLGAYRKAQRSIPIVAVSEGLEPQWINYADAIGAVDLLFKPFNIERVLTAVRAAMTGIVRVASHEGSNTVSPLGIKPRVLLLSKDPELSSRVSRGLTERGFDVDVSPTVAEALERTDHASYHAALYDAPTPAVTDRLFVSQLRARAAMGLVPVLYLAPLEAHSIFSGIDTDRGAVRQRTDGAGVLADTLNNLWADSRLGRNFLRYPMVLPVELRYGGRVFTGESIDMSRGGMMLRCDQIPPVGTEVNLSIRLPNAAHSVSVSGLVTRVDVPSNDEPRARIGVEFERFAQSDESELIAFLKSLDPTPMTRTVILGAPAPAR